MGEKLAIAFRPKDIELTLDSLLIGSSKLAVERDETTSSYNICKTIFPRAVIGH